MLLIVTGTAIEAGSQSIDLPVRALPLKDTATLLVVMKRGKPNANSHLLKARVPASVPASVLRLASFD